METVTIFIMGKPYEVPKDLTIMKAMEYAGYKFIRSCGCRGGFCGACATVYRPKNDYRLKMALACQKTVEDGMYIGMIPFTPAKKVTYNIGKVKPVGNVLLKFFPEIARCVSCNTCTRACPQTLEVMNIVQAALRGDIEESARLSFDCIQCGLCGMRCPAEIVPYNVAQLARRLYGKYLAKPANHLKEKLKEIDNGKFNEDFELLVKAPVEKIKKVYEQRDIKV